MRHRVIPLCLLVLAAAAGQSEGGEPINHAFKGSEVGVTALAEFRSKNAIPGGDRPYCSDRPKRGRDWFLLDAWEARAGVVACTTNGPDNIRRGDWRAETIADAPGIAVYDFLDGILFRITVRYDSQHYRTIEATVADIYGPPVSTGARRIQNRLGAWFENRHATWMKPASSIIMSERGAGGKVDGGLLLIYHEPLVAKLEARGKSRKRDF